MPITIQDNQAGGTVTVTAAGTANVSASKSWVTVGVSGSGVVLTGTAKVPPVDPETKMIFVVYFRGPGRVDPNWNVEYVEEGENVLGIFAAASVGVFNGTVVQMNNLVLDPFSIIAQSSLTFSASITGFMGAGGTGQFTITTTKSSAAYWPIDGEWVRVRMKGIP